MDVKKFSPPRRLLLTERSPQTFGYENFFLFNRLTLANANVEVTLANANVEIVCSPTQSKALPIYTHSAYACDGLAPAPKARTSVKHFEGVCKAL